MEDQPEEQAKDRYDLLLGMLETDLANTGFNPEKEPPGLEPRLPKGVSSLPQSQLRAHYDDYQAFYEFLTDQLIKILPHLETNRERAKTTLATVRGEVSANTALTNKEARDSAIETDERVIGTRVRVVYLETLQAAQEERRKKMSKAMERLYRELMLRTDQHTPAPPMPEVPPARRFPAPPTTGVSRFKPISYKKPA